MSILMVDLAKLSEDQQDAAVYERINDGMIEIREDDNTYVTEKARKVLVLAPPFPLTSCYDGSYDLFTGQEWKHHGFAQVPHTP